MLCSRSVSWMLIQIRIKSLSCKIKNDSSNCQKPSWYKTTMHIYRRHCSQHSCDKTRFCKASKARKTLQYHIPVQTVTGGKDVNARKNQTKDDVRNSTDWTYYSNVSNKAKKGGLGNNETALCISEKGHEWSSEGPKGKWRHSRWICKRLKLNSSWRGACLRVLWLHDMIWNGRLARKGANLPSTLEPTFH